MNRIKRIEMRDGLTGELECIGTLAEFRDANTEDADVLDALNRLARGESKSELVGAYRLSCAREEVQS